MLPRPREEAWANIVAIHNYETQIDDNLSFSQNFICSPLKLEMSETIGKDMSVDDKGEGPANYPKQ